MSLKKVFHYLDKLRESGRTNMWGASAWIEADLGLSPEDAKAAHLKWMETFDGKTTLDERVATAEKA